MSRPRASLAIWVLIGGSAALLLWCLIIPNYTSAPLPTASVPVPQVEFTVAPSPPGLEYDDPAMWIGCEWVYIGAGAYERIIGRPTSRPRRMPGESHDDGVEQESRPAGEHKLHFDVKVVRQTVRLSAGSAVRSEDRREEFGFVFSATAADAQQVFRVCVNREPYCRPVRRLLLPEQKEVELSRVDGSWIFTDAESGRSEVLDGRLASVWSSCGSERAKLRFSAAPIDGATHLLRRLGALESRKGWYQCEPLDVGGWLTDYDLLMYFASPPDKIFLQVTTD